MLFSVIVVPQLCGDEYVFTLNQSLLDSSANTFSSLFFVLIVVCTIEETIPDFDCLLRAINGVSHSPYVFSCVYTLVPLTLYTVSAAVSLGTFQSPNPTRGISRPEARVTVVFPIFLISMLYCFVCSSKIRALLERDMKWLVGSSSRVVSLYTSCSICFSRVAISGMYSHHPVLT